MGASYTVIGSCYYEENIIGRGESGFIIDVNNSAYYD
jgi:hypothetical protein